MNRLKVILSSLLRDECGQDLIEYVLVAALIALGAVMSMRSLAGSVSVALGNVGSRLTESV